MIGGEGRVLLKDTLSGELRPLEKERPVLIYVCGATVYDYSHIGHARTFIIFDVLRRLLLHDGYQVRYVQNFTDVDDKIIRRAQELGISPFELAQRFIDQYFEDFDALNVMRADEYPRATETIPKMVELIGNLLERKKAYKTKTGIYYRVSSFPSYGKLSKKPLTELRAGARVEVDPTKEDPLDFALWKFVDDEPSWDTPWGKGRPGWHIECSAMVAQHLGDTIDVHGGGQDLIFPHHENEIAQSEAYTGRPLARIWMHIGLLKLEEEKMSKSKGNIVTVREALKLWGANVIRLFSIASHYRQPLNFGEKMVKNAQENWELIETAAWELLSAVGEGGADQELVKEVSTLRDEVITALRRDLNTPAALGRFMRMVRLVNRSASNGRLNRATAQALQRPFHEVMDLFGLKIASVTQEEMREVEALVMERDRLRKERRYQEADAIRERLREMGYRLLDHPNRTIWMKVTLAKGASGSDRSQTS